MKNKKNRVFTRQETMGNTTEIPTEEPKPSHLDWLFFIIPLMIILCCFLCACISEDKRVKESRRRAAQDIISL